MNGKNPSKRLEFESMSQSILFIFALLTPAIACGLIITGHWRMVFALFRVQARAMTWERRGLRVRDAESRDRVNAILRTFVEAFNVMITARNSATWQTYCESRPPLLRAFAEEGIAMGYRLRRMGLWNARAFEQALVAPRKAFAYLHYVGLGFWSGMRKHSPQQVAATAAPLDALHRYLCFDGYGFQRAFFDAPQDPRALDTLMQLPGYAANAAFQGVGRALWFRYMDDHEALITAMEALGLYAADGAAGAGLAATFVNPDRMHIAMELGRKLPAHLQPHFHLGMCFACKARDLNDPEWFSASLGKASRELRAAIRASIAACDRIENEVRAELPVEPYGEWRRRMTDWLTQSIEFPMAAVQSHVIEIDPHSKTASKYL